MTRGAGRRSSLGCCSDACGACYDITQNDIQIISLDRGYVSITVIINPLQFSNQKVWIHFLTAALVRHVPIKSSLPSILIRVVSF